MEELNIVDELTSIRDSARRMNGIRKYIRETLGVRNIRDIEDIIQSSFLNAYKAAEGFRWNGAKPLTWLYRIIKNKAIDFLKKNTPTNVTDCPNPKPTLTLSIESGNSTLPMIHDIKLTLLRDNAKEEIRNTQGMRPRLAESKPWDASPTYPGIVRATQRDKDNPDWLRTYDSTSDATLDAQLAGLPVETGKLWVMYEQGFTVRDIAEMVELQREEVIEALNYSYLRILINTLRQMRLSARDIIGFVFRGLFILNEQNFEHK